MAAKYSVETCKQLAEAFRDAGVLRPLRIDRHEPGTQMTFEMTGVLPARKASVTVEIERFIGGGFAGQVYLATVRGMHGTAGPIEGLEIGGAYALKVLIPPSTFSRVFRNAIYAVGFQSPFQQQTNPTAVRAGALWQKFIRRGAGERLGDPRAVVDIYATFVDPVLGGCGEIREWLEGRTWRFEVDDNLLARWFGRPQADTPHAGSPEYRAKKRFMAELVKLFHDMGAPELARQYEWSTCKSQPNVLKRSDCEGDPAAGLTAVDFRAGLALLPLLPMSPGDVPLIARGLARGSLVQFDRGDVDKLANYVEARRGVFADMLPALAELREAERHYRNSQVDLTHNHVRLLYDRELWRTLGDSSVTGWRVKRLIDEPTQQVLRASRLRTAVFWTLGLVPLLGRAVRKLWGRADYRAHYRMLFRDADYFVRAFYAHAAETLIRWHRAGRISAERARRWAKRPTKYLWHVPLSVLPAGLHRMLTDAAYAREKLRGIFVRPVRLYFNARAREEWLREMVAEGRRHHMVTDEDADKILSRIDEPFIQKYLKSLAVHVCTLPITQVVSLIVATWYVLAHPELTWQQASAAFAGILVAFQIVPISPGSFVRGAYVLYLVIRERNVRDYNIAVFLGFFKYIGYLAFPIQMAYKYPALARFMAGHWATGAVHVVPVFGERGALLEHFVFDLFYNYPLSLRRRMAARAEARKTRAPRYWHAVAAALGGAGCLAAFDAAFLDLHGVVPALREAWPMGVIAAAVAGGGAAAWAGGCGMRRRVMLAVFAGLGMAAIYAAANYALTRVSAWPRSTFDAVKLLTWSAFVFTLVSTVAGLLAETHARVPQRSGQ